MPTPDRRPGPLVEEEVQLEDRTADGDPTIEGAFRYASGAFKFKDSTGVFDPRTGGSGISEAQHKTLRQLIHFIDSGPAEGFASGAYLEILPSGNPFPTSEIWYTSAAKTDKIVELSTTYNSNKTIATEVWRVYDTDGSTVLATITDTYAYSGVIITDITRTIA